MRKYYLVTTEHLKVGLWFRDESDFRAGMNFVAIQAYESKVTVLAFILMSNHLHFVVEGRWADVKAFIDGIKSRYSKYLNHKYGTAEFLRRNKVTIEEVSTLNEELEKAIAYTQMNCVAANICSHPSQYPWGTGPLFFNASKRTGRRLGSLFGKQRFEDLLPEEQTESLRQIQRRFCSNVHQIARVTGLTYEAAARMMDSV